MGDVVNLRSRRVTTDELFLPDCCPEPTEGERREMEECKAVMRRTGYVEGAVNPEPMSDVEFEAMLDAVFPLEGNSHTPPLTLRLIEGGGSDPS